MKSPEFIVFCGPMGGGKTSSLLAYVDRCKYQKKSVVIFKPALDTRYSKTCIVSHGGWQANAIVIASVNEMYAHVANLDTKPDVIGFDEVFMLEGIADALIWLFKEGITIVASSLDISYQGKPFKEVERILSWSTRVEKCAAVCTVCGCDAYYTHKKIWNDNEIEVGGLDLYESRCFEHHPLIRET